MEDILSTEGKVRVKFSRMYGVPALDFAQTGDTHSFHPEEMPTPGVPEAPALVKPACSPDREALRSRFLGWRDGSAVKG